MTTPKPAAEKTALPDEQPVEQVPEVKVVEPTAEPEAIPAHDAEWWRKRANAIERENEKSLKRLAALEAEEKKREEAELSELDKANKKIAELQAETKAQARRELQRRVAEKVKLPAVFADRIQGDDEASMEADAIALLAAMPAPLPPKGNPTNPGMPRAGETHDEQAVRLGLRRG